MERHPVTVDNLVLKAYLEFPPIWDHVDRFFQRCFYTVDPQSVSPTRVKAYFINFDITHYPEEMGGEAWEAHCQFTLANGQTVDVRVHHDEKWTINDVEEFFEDFFYHHKCRPEGA